MFTNRPEDFPKQSDVEALIIIAVAASRHDPILKDQDAMTIAHNIKNKEIAPDNDLTYDAIEIQTRVKAALEETQRNNQRLIRAFENEISATISSQEKIDRELQAIPLPHAKRMSDIFENHAAAITKAKSSLHGLIAYKASITAQEADLDRAVETLRGEKLPSLSNLIGTDTPDIAL